MDALQLTLPAPRTRGGRRIGAGRRPASHRRGVPHRRRPEHKSRHPLHVTLRVRRGLPPLREQVLFTSVRRALGQASNSSFRLVQYSVQSDHLHLLVEAHDKTTLSRGVAGLTIRIARAINRLLGCRGRVWGGRYHARPLRTPREVRNALVYVLQNWRKHQPGSHGIDPCSSGSWFDGWSHVTPGPTPVVGGRSPPTAAARTWLASTGWRRHGLLSLHESPARARWRARSASAP
jgi:putative transposase